MLNRQLVIAASTISVDGASVGATYDIPLGDPTQYSGELIDFFTMSGSVTLTSSLTITSTYTPVSPVKLVFLSRANVTIGSNTFTIFGHSLTAYQAANPFQLVAFWDGVAWSATLSLIEVPTTGLPNSKLSQMPPFTFKMNSGNGAAIPQDVTGEDVAELLNVQYDHIPFIINYNSGAISPGSYRQDILIPYAGEVTRVYGYVFQQIGGVDDAELTIGIASSAGGGSSNFVEHTIPANTTTNTNYTILPADFVGAATFNANYYLTIEATKGTWGGQAMFTVVTKREI